MGQFHLRKKKIDCPMKRTFADCQHTIPTSIVMPTNLISPLCKMTRTFKDYQTKHLQLRILGSLMYPSPNNSNKKQSYNDINNGQSHLQVMTYTLFPLVII